MSSGTKYRSRFVTLMVIPETSSPRRMTLTSRHLLGLGVLGCVLIVLAVLLTVHVFHLQHQVKTLETVALENKILKEKFNETGSQLNRIQAELEIIHTFAKKLRLMTSLEDPQRNHSLQFTEIGSRDLTPDGTPLDGLGSVAARGMDHEPVFSFYRQESEFILPKLYELENRIKTLWVKSDQESQNIQTLYELVQDQHTLLKSTPSLLPARGIITSRFGFRIDRFTGQRRMHTGIDVFNHEGTPIYAPADGRVVYTGRKPDYGVTLIIEHGYGLTTRYAHNQKNLVKVGQKVVRGDVIATMGTTGRSTGPHVHYEVRINRVPVDPSNYILGTLGPLSSATQKPSR